MKKVMVTLVLCGIFTLCCCPATSQADTLGDKIKAFNTKIETQLQKVVDYINAYYHSDAVQAKIAEIKANEKAVVKTVLTAIYNYWLQYQDAVVSLVETKIQVAILKVEAKIVDGLKIFQAQAAAAYEKAVAKLIAKLPANVQTAVNAIRANTAGTRAAVAQKIMDYLTTKINEGTVAFNTQVDTFIEAKLAELDANVAAKIAAL